MSYSRSSYRASSSSYRFSSEGGAAGGDEGFTSSYKSTSRTGTGTGSRLSRLDSDDIGLSTTRRNTRPREESFESTSSSRVSGRLYDRKDSDDDFSTSKRIASRTASRTEDSGSYSRKYSRGLSADLDSSTGVDSYLSTRKTSRSHGLDDSSNDYLISKKTSRDYGEESSSTTRKYSGRIYAALEDDLDTSGSGIASTIRSSRITSKLTEDENYGLSATTKRGLSRLGSTEDDGLAIGSGGLTASGRYKRSESQESSLLYRQSSNVSDEGSFKSSNRKRSLDRVDSYKSYKASALDEDRPVSPSFRLKSRSSTINEENIYVAVLDYSPPKSAQDEIELKEGQEVIVLNKDKPHKWKVQTRPCKQNRISEEGFVPSCYLEQKTPYDPSHPVAEDEPEEIDPKIEEAKKRRKNVLKELVETEEDFNRDMQFIANTYLKHMDSSIMPKELRDQKVPLFGCFKEIADFHNDVLMKGVQYYAAEDPSKVGNTFLRLERDFDKHVRYCHDLPQAQKLLESGPLKDYFDNYSSKIKDDKSLADHLKLPVQRINDYQLLLKELIKYSNRLGEDSGDLCKALELMRVIPQRATDLQFINNMIGYKGNLHKSGRLLKHVLRAKDWFQVIQDESSEPVERYVFLFTRQLITTDVVNLAKDRQGYVIKTITKLEDVNFEDVDDLTINVQHKEPGVKGFPFKLQAKTAEIIKSWKQEIQDVRKLAIEELADIPDPEISDDGTDCLKLDDISKGITPEPLSEDLTLQQLSGSQVTSDIDTKVGLAEDLATNDGSNTVMTESLRSGSVTDIEACDLEAKPVFRQPLKPVNQHVGEKAVLECQVKSALPVNVTWLKDNAKLRESENVQFITSSDKFILTIDGITNDDSGLYTVIASNDKGKTSSSAALNVKQDSLKPDSRPTTPGGSVLPHPPKFKIKLKDTELLEGTTVRFEMIVRGLPIPNVTFYKDDKPLITDDRVRIIYENKEIFELFIDHVKPEDAGVYKAIAINTHGEDSTSGKVTITKHKDIFKGLEDDHFLGEPESLDISRADSRSSRPRTPAFRWFKDGQEFEASERFQCTFDDEEDTIALIFQHVTPDDAGLYTCVASTSSGKISCSAELSVQGEVRKLLREPEKPAVKVPISDIEVNEGASAMLEAKITGYPKPLITWYKDNEEIKVDEKYKFLYEDEESYTLVIKGVRRDDASKYRLKASNDLGEVETSGQLTVNSAPKVKRELKDQSVMTDEPMTLDVVVEGTPTPTAKWFKDGQPVKLDDRVKIVDKDETHSLVIDPVKLEDAGNYTCIVSNSCGQQTGQSVVTVNSPPKFQLGLKDVSAKDGDTIEFKVKVSGNPEPEVVLMKDGKKLDRQISTEKEAEVYRFKIRSTTVEDTGKYQCVAKNQYGSETSEGSLTIVTKPSFDKRLEDIECKEGDTNVDLKVKISGSPRPKVRWLFEEEEISQSSKRTEIIEEEDGVFILRIKEASLETAGKYTIVAVNSEGEVRSSGIVDVKKDESKQYDQRKPVFGQKLRDLEALETDLDVTFKASIEEPDKTKITSIRWYIDDIEITESDRRFKIMSDDSIGVFKLVVRRPDESVEGKYKLIVENPYGYDETNASFTIMREPKFIKKLRDKDIDVNDKLTLTVKVDGVPEPTLTWFKDEQEITKISEKVVIGKIDDAYSLTIDSAQSVDEGVYKCSAKNKIGEDSTSARITVLSPPNFTKGLTDISVSADLDLTLEVQVTGADKVEWYKDGLKICEATSEADGITHRLPLKSVKLDDAGDYKAVARNAFGRVDSGTGHLTVKTENKEAPKFVEPLTDVAVQSGEDVTFTVKVTGSPTPKVIWSINGKEVTPSEHIIVSDLGNNTHSLTVKGSQTDDQASYSVSAVNDSGKAQDEAKLTIKVAAEKPKISGLKDIEIERGSTALIGCTVTGSPKPEVVWMKDGVKLSTGDEFEIISDSDTKHSIYVKKASESTQGTYIVSAKNIEGSSEADVKLTLIAEPPKFIKNLTDCSGSLGSELTLEAEVKGFPPPVVSWYKNGSELIESSEAFVSQVGTLNKLSLKDLKSSDAGEYTCKAENKAGEANSTAKISIEKPELIKGLPDSLNGKQGDVLKLEAKLSNDSTNEPIKWLKDGKEIPQNDRLKTKILPDGTLILTIEDAQPEDSGVYQVVVGNDGPNQVNSSSNVSVSPKEFVKPNVEPKFIEDLHDVSVKEGSPFKMEAKVTGHPKPEICWFKDDEPISPNPHCGFISEPDGTIGLMFDHCNGDDAGRYKAIATNSSGEVITTGKLTVDKPTMKPSFSADLSPVDVAEGQPLVLTGVVDGHPPPNIKWLKDGEEIKPNSRITMSQSPDGTVTLSINSASPDDEGKYTVAAANDEGRVRSSAPVSVRRLSRSLSKPSFDEGLKPTTLKAGEPTTLSVAVSGEPSPEVKWLKDGHPIEPDDRHHFTDKPPNTKCLTIDDVKPEDAGNYSVVAGNDLGEDKTSAPIKVNQSPRFVKPLDGNIEAVDGFPIKLEVKTEGEPKPELTWFKDGETIIPDGDRLRIINEPDGVSSLIITKTLPNDKGHYSCAAVNPLGTNKTEGDVSVGPTKKNDQAESIPRLIKNLSDCEVDEGKTMKFEAHIEGNPINEVKWFRNGEPLTIGSNIVPYFDGKRAGLEIRNCGPMDQGDYEVKLGNSLGTISSKSRGIVRSRDPPKFTQKLIDSTFGTKSPISLNCSVSGNPEPEVQWYHNGKLIEPGLKYQLKRESNLLSLIINNPTSNDGGTIECRATNPVGSDSTRCSIKVSDRSTKEEPAAFIKRFNEYECTEGQSAKFTACIVGNPKPELKWFKDGKDFEPTSRHLIDVETNGIVRLTIRNVEPADVGEYQLFISNPHGNDSSSAKLTIDNMDKKYRRRSMDVGKELSKRSGLPSGLLEKPRIIRMWDTGISLGWKPAIPSYSGIPVTYTLDWCKHPYSDSDWKPYRTGILDNRCDIRNLEPGQDYSFRVRVENKLGVSDPSPVVTAFRSKLIDPDAKPKDYEIERPPIDKIACAPRWLRKEDDEMYGIRGRPVTIIFWVYGYPEPDIKWFFNDIEIQIGTGNYDVMKDRNGKVCLFINRMTEKDVGTYSCHATNEHGEAWKKIKLLQAEPPSFILRLKETTGMAYKSTRMECKVTGIPMPTVKWFKDWLPIHDSDRTKILWEESENRSTLFINSTISRDAGLYSVTATNVVGSASCSANLAIEDDEILFNWANYIPRVIRPRKKALEDYYDLGDELGRGTQGVTYHAVERASGNNYAIKMMHGKEDTKPFMDRELEMMNQFFHPKLVRLWDAFDHKETLALITDICGGGELLEAIVGRGQLTEKEIANYIRQILEGLNHMHGREIGHFGLTIGDILLERIDGEDVKIADFSLSRRLIPGKSVILEYGHPEFVAPEIVNKQPISLAADLWSVGVLTYILLTGISPFLGQNDRETLSRLKEGKISFSHETFVHVSEDAKDFLSKLLIIDPTKRLDVKKALEHRWISGDSINHREDKLPCIDALKEYLKKWRDWYKNASCRKYYRRNPLDYCFEHPSKMIYPPDEPYKPSEPPVVDHKPKFKPSEMDDSVSPRPGYDPANFTSESQYQSGPDTYLLPHRDVDFPLRIREYLRVGASRSPSLANSLRSSHWGDTNLGIGQRCSPQVAVRERRRFVEVMDEEIEDERKGLDTRTVPMRLQHEIGTPGYAYGQIHQLKQEAALHLGRDVSVKIVPPFFREKIKDVVVTEGSIGLFSCFAVGEPKPTYTWFRNDGIIIESPRISVKQLSSGRVELTINPVHAYDAGCYKCVARNEHGAIFCRARLRIGTAPEKPEPPEVRGTSATEAYLVWSQPKGLGNSWITSYSLEYSIHGTNEWNILVDRLSQEFYLVRNLSPGTSYTFRVKAKNKFGWSEFSEPSEPSTTAPVGSDVRISLPRGQKEKLLIGETLTEAKWEELAAPDLDYSRERQPIEMKQGIEPTALYHTSSDEIARGHFSVIIKAACKETEKPLALKICLVENQASSGIMNEYEMLKSLCHERIVSLYSATCGSDTIALGMERLSGVDVLTYLSQSTVYSEDTVTRIIQQVLDGIEYLHFQGICMLELQPDNIVLINNHFPNIKLIDFANARHVPPNGTKVTIKGSPEYLAPEIIKREEVSTATDIWCVGILAYILLSGASPFKGETEEETIENVSYVRYHFDHLYKEVTQEAIRFLMLVFKRSPSKRPTIEECSDHKWLMPNEYAVRKRESTLFSSNKLAQFNENLRSDKSCSTPDKLLKILGIS
ncbi:obscurin-like isoform X4 [Panonychus citri]|uniref:obscurin-like isoform X4 n=1 Tax=Panonychus citri TaxID=50023 RepID=UPI0023080732|nr:obscurin-like isoform X4 [Panonychus citri]